VRAEPVGAPDGQALPPFPCCGRGARGRWGGRCTPERCRGHPQPPALVIRANRTGEVGVAARKTMTTTRGIRRRSGVWAARGAVQLVRWTRVAGRVRSVRARWSTCCGNCALVTKTVSSRRGRGHAPARRRLRGAPRPVAVGEAGSSMPRTTWASENVGDPRYGPCHCRITRSRTMSWDVVLVNAPQALTVQEIPRDFVPPPLGPATELLDRLRAALPDLNLSDPTWGNLDSPDWSIEFNIGREDPVESIMLHVR